MTAHQTPSRLLPRLVLASEDLPLRERGQEWGKLAGRGGKKKKKNSEYSLYGHSFKPLLCMKSELKDTQGKKGKGKGKEREAGRGWPATASFPLRPRLRGIAAGGVRGEKRIKASEKRKKKEGQPRLVPDDRPFLPNATRTKGKKRRWRCAQPSAVH